MRAGITCLCVTHGRPYLLREAVESFRRQVDFGVPVEMLIVNDCPEQTLTCAVPHVTVVNLRDPITDLSAKFNAAVDMVQTEWIAWWEDDDISLRGRLDYSFFMATQADVDVYKQGRAWFMEHGAIVSRPCNLFFGSSLFRRSAWRGAAWGLPADKSAWERMTDRAAAVDHYVPAAATSFIYRWGGTGHHDSGVRGSNADRFAAFRKATLGDRRFRAGVIDVEPFWAQDYEAEAQAAIKDGRGDN